MSKNEKVLTSMVGAETEAIKNSPAGKFMAALGWVADRKERLMKSLKSDVKVAEMETLIGQHVDYLFKHRATILQMILVPVGDPLPMQFRDAHRELQELINDDCFEACQSVYEGKRKPVSMLYRDLNELYKFTSKVDQLYNDRFQSDKFHGVVVQRLRYIKTMEAEVIKLIERVDK